MGYQLTQNNGSVRFTDDPARVPVIHQPAVGSIRMKHEQFGHLHHVTLTLDNVGQTVVNGTEYQGTKIFTFPEGIPSIIGMTATFQQKTTSVLADTLNASSTGAVSLGTAAASATTLSGTMVDFIASTAFTSSATINVPGTAVNAVAAGYAAAKAPKAYDGTATAVDMYLNTAYATTTDVDANATQTISGTIKFAFIDVGDH